jgi:hypothetical protein
MRRLTAHPYSDRILKMPLKPFQDFIPRAAIEDVSNPNLQLGFFLL